MPVRNSSRPVLEVSMWPLNIRFLPPPDPFHRPTTLARASSTSCQVTSRPIFCSADRMYCAICSSSPVGLGILITSLDKLGVEGGLRVCVCAGHFVQFPVLGLQ